MSDAPITPEVPPAKLGGFIAVVAIAAVCVGVAVHTLGARLPLPAWAVEWIDPIPEDDDDQDGEDDE